MDSNIVALMKTSGCLEDGKSVKTYSMLFKKIFVNTGYEYVQFIVNELKHKKTPVCSFNYG